MERMKYIMTVAWAEQSEMFDPDNTYPPIMTQAEFRKWMKIGDPFLKYLISKGMPTIKNENGSIRIPRDAVRVWLRDNWQVLA
ncbi:TPA: DNA-binding protein [Streptococcus suis]|nr:DNA-binding protein [Streptococcus suis]